MVRKRLSSGRHAVIDRVQLVAYELELDRLGGTKGDRQAPDGGPWPRRTRGCRRSPREHVKGPPAARTVSELGVPPAACGEPELAREPRSCSARSRGHPQTRPEGRGSFGFEPSPIAAVRSAA